VIDQAVRVEHLTKAFKGKTVLDGISLAVAEGEVCGLLGPNGAGKTTLVKILCTLLRPDGGRAEVFGYDVTREPRQVRRLIGLTGQYAAVDEILSARENLYMIGRLLGQPARRAKTRANELLDSFGLTASATKPVKTFSGGMRRRLDLAASLTGEPKVLFLDEPTTGLDVTSRGQLWELVAGLARNGTTVLLTTQYLDEADRLAGAIVVIDRGHVIAEGTPAALKERAGGQVIEVRPAQPSDIGTVTRLLTQIAHTQATASNDTVAVPATDPDLLGTAVGRLREANIPVSQVGLRLPSLDEAFIRLTNGANR
jgi:oleandomycin transport system ATP-binding protein